MPESLRAYLIEKRRALLLELTALEKALGIEPTRFPKRQRADAMRQGPDECRLHSRPTLDAPSGSGV